MAKAAESVGCGNEIEDTIRDKAVKIPSWPLYYSLSKNSPINLSLSSILKPIVGNNLSIFASNS